mmetsp:Transcript_111075/g.265153  ORF Transcript_111075/g.265153 Transcript_111075/m.265153 type:complete len:246 (-) Transcript_111075:1054-1791(-)
MISPRRMGVSEGPKRQALRMLPRANTCMAVCSTKPACKKSLIWMSQERGCQVSASARKIAASSHMVRRTTVLYRRSASSSSAQRLHQGWFPVPGTSQAGRRGLKVSSRTVCRDKKSMGSMWGSRLQGLAGKGSGDSSSCGRFRFTGECGCCPLRSLSSSRRCGVLGFGVEGPELAQVDLYLLDRRLNFKCRSKGESDGLSFCSNLSKAFCRIFPSFLRSSTEKARIRPFDCFTRLLLSSSCASSI